MTEFDRDPVIARAIEELKTLPPVDTRRIDGVVHAAADARVSAAEEDGVGRHRRFGRLSMIAAVAAAAAIAGFMLRGVVVSRDNGTTPVRAPATSVRAASATDAQSMPVPEHFVFESATARHVSLVGDFNE